MVAGIRIWNENRQALTISNEFLNFAFKQKGTVTCNQQHYYDGGVLYHDNVGIFYFYATAPLVGIKNGPYFTCISLTQVSTGYWKAIVKSNSAQPTLSWYVFDRYSQIPPSVGFLVRNSAGDIAFSSAEKPMIIKEVIEVNTWYTSNQTVLRTSIENDVLIVLSGRGTNWSDNPPPGVGRVQKFCEPSISVSSGQFVVGRYEHSGLIYSVQPPEEPDSYGGLARIMRVEGSFL